MIPFGGIQDAWAVRVDLAARLAPSELNGALQPVVTSVAGRVIRLGELFLGHDGHRAAQRVVAAQGADW